MFMFPFVEDFAIILKALRLGINLKVYLNKMGINLRQELELRIRRERVLFIGIWTKGWSVGVRFLVEVSIAG